MAAISLGIGAALCWGLADFLGGVRTRRLTLAAVLLVSQLTGLAAAVAVVAITRPDAPAVADILPALGAGVCQLAGIAALYRALATGTMSVVSPVSASGAAVIPLIVGVATGERPGALQFAGMAAAFVGVALASGSVASGGRTPPRQPLALVAVAALGFGGFYVGMNAAVDAADPFWALLAARAAAGAALVIVMLALRPAIGAGPAHLPALALIGLLDVGANACFTFGTDTGLLSVVAVLASLYPVTTVVLARGVLGERLAPAQTAGVAVALAGVAMIAAG